MRGFLRGLLLLLAAVTGIGIVAYLLVVLLGVRVDLTPLRPVIEAAASQAIGREVQLVGAPLLVPTLSPTIEVHDVRIANPRRWGEEDFARMALARLELDALALLWGRIHLREIRAEGVAVRLERRATGDYNWDLGPAADPEPVEPSAETPPILERLVALGFTSAEIERLDLAEIEVSYRASRDAEPVVFALETLSGSAATDKPLQVDASGSFRGHPYRFSVSGGQLEDLLLGESEFPIELTLEVAETTLHIESILDEGSMRLDELLELVLDPDDARGTERFADVRISLRGERLDRLDSLVGIALPPLGPFELEAGAEGHLDGRLLADLSVEVGTSRLTGRGEFVVGASPPRAELVLVADEIQLDDFHLGEWSPLEEAATDEGLDAADPALSPPLEPRALLDPEALRKLDFALSATVGRVRSGDDRLGAGKLVMRLQRSRFALETLALEVPGGSLELAAEIERRDGEIEASIRMLVERFDYGILARRTVPTSEMSGLFGLDVDLRTRAPSLDALLQHANGHVDFAVLPREFESGVFDLWAVSLMSAVLPQLDSSESSKINCAIGRFDMIEGVLQENLILVDTTKMRATGDARVDFRTQAVHAELAPQAKRPEFFSLATPIQVDGHIQDFTVGVRPEDLFGTIILFTTSAIHVPLQRVFTGRLPSDGADVCRAEMGRGRAPDADASSGAPAARAPAAGASEGRAAR